MVSFKIEVKKRDITWVVFLAVVLAVGVVYAYGTSSPSVMGHSAGEIDFSGGLEVGGDVKANRMVDSDNTGYYVDPAGTSRFNTINLNTINLNGINAEALMKCYGQGGSTWYGTQFTNNQCNGIGLATCQEVSGCILNTYSGAGKHCRWTCKRG